MTVRVVEPPPGRGRTPRHPWGQPLRASLAVSAAGSPDRPRRPGGGWRFCGGVPRRLVVDNLKAVVTRADRLRSRSRASSRVRAIPRLRRRSRCRAPCHRETESGARDPLRPPGLLPRGAAAGAGGLPAPASASSSAQIVMEGPSLRAASAPSLPKGKRRASESAASRGPSRSRLPAPERTCSGPR